MPRVSFACDLAEAGNTSKPHEIPDMDDDKDKAKARTKWAEDRTIMANERTFSSWMGAGMGAVGVAIGLKAVFGAFEPTWAAKAVASSFLLIAIVIFWAARRQAKKTLKRLSGEDSEPMPSKSFTLLAALMTGATLAVGAILWSL